MFSRNHHDIEILFNLVSANATFLNQLYEFHQSLLLGGTKGGEGAFDIVYGGWRLRIG